MWINIKHVPWCHKTWEGTSCVGGGRVEEKATGGKLWRFLKVGELFLCLSLILNYWTWIFFQKMCNLTPSTLQLGTEEYIQYNMFLQWHYLEEQKKLKNWRLKSSESSIDFSKQNAKLICCNMQYKLCQICTFISGVNVGNSRYLSMEPTVIRVLKSRRGLTRGWRFYRKCSDNVDLYNTFLHRRL